MWDRLMMMAVAMMISTAATADETGKHYVTANVLNERLAPVDGKVINRIYRGQAVTVYEVRDGWARVTNGQQKRWVSMSHLSRVKPADLAQPDVTGYQDSRIVQYAIPKSGEDGLTDEDVVILWKGAKHFLDSGRCSKIEIAHKSLSKPNTYYVNCGEPQNIFFTPDDL